MNNTLPVHSPTPIKQSARYPFIAEHRGGPLTKENHQKLIKWARECSGHVLSLMDGKMDPRLSLALKIAEEWENDRVATGAAMKASLGAHATARASIDPVSKAVARSIGQAVATAHMADHSLGAAFYALKAVKLAHGNLEKEKAWQSQKLSRLPSDIQETIQKMWKSKGLDEKI